MQRGRQVGSCRPRRFANARHGRGYVCCCVAAALPVSAVVLLFPYKAQCVCTAYTEQCRKALYYGYCGRIARIGRKGRCALRNSCSCHQSQYGCYHRFFHLFSPCFLGYGRRGVSPPPVPLLFLFYFTTLITSSPAFTSNTPSTDTGRTVSTSAATVLLTIAPFTV